MIRTVKQMKAGRWLSPDPYGWGAADLTHPQSLNRYGYVLNNPSTFVDPLGLDGAGYNWVNGCLYYDYSVPLSELTNSANVVSIRLICLDISGWTPGVPGGGGGGGYAGSGGGGGGAPENPPQPKKPPCKPATRVAGLYKAFDGAITSTAMGNLSLLGYYGSFIVVGASCAPEPGVFITCPAGLFAGGSLAASATVMGYGAYKVANEEMIPGIRQAITCAEAE